jgi:hypothetical protein
VIADELGECAGIPRSVGLRRAGKEDHAVDALERDAQGIDAAFASASCDLGGGLRRARLKFRKRLGGGAGRGRRCTAAASA